MDGCCCFEWLNKVFPRLQGLTIDSRVTDGAPPRVINGALVPDLRAFWAERRAGQTQHDQEEDL